MKQLRDHLKETLSALVEADEHIRTKLQPEFDKLSRGEDVSHTDTFGRQVALERLATWWHGVGTQDTIREAAAALAASGDATEASAALAMRELINDQLATSWTREGVSAWWERPRHQLDGATPAQAFQTDPMRVYRLAVAGRSQGAA